MERPKVGVGVFVLKDRKILLQKRLGAHGEGTWAPPGGHLEFGESFFDAAKREVMEEIGIEITNLRFISVTNDIFMDEGKHYITIFVAGDYFSGEPRILEKDKISEMNWFDIESFPEPLFTPVKNLIQNKCFPVGWKDQL